MDQYIPYLEQDNGPFLEVHNGWAFVFQNVIIRVDANQQIGTESAGLEHGTSMAYIVGVRGHNSSQSSWTLRAGCDFSP